MYWCEQLSICSLSMSCYSFSTCCLIIRKLMNLNDNQQRGNRPLITIFFISVTRFKIKKRLSQMSLKKFLYCQRNVYVVENEEVVFKFSSPSSRSKKWFNRYKRFFGIFYWNICQKVKDVNYSIFSIMMNNILNNIIQMM